MIGKRLLLACAVLISGTVYTVQAQNARIDALGGAFIVPDFSRTLANPAFMNDYKNHVEINVNIPALLATKSGGNIFSFGTYMNRGLMLRYFYPGAGAQLNFPPYIVTPAASIPGVGTMQYFPHILWGIDLKTLQIGFDTYLEWGRASYSSSNAVPGAIQTIDETLSIMHPGLVAGFKINLPSATILFTLGGGLPRATGTVERVNIAPIGTAKIETEAGMFGRAGFEVMVNLGSTGLTIGTDGRYENFQFSQLAPTAGATKVRSNKTNGLTVIPYAGTQTRVGANILIVALGRTSIDILETKNDAGTATTTNYELRHALVGGFEKQFQNPWKFDSIAVRGGVTWGAVNTWTKAELTTPILATSTTSPITTLGPMFPYVGLGFSKSKLCVDLVINPASWTNIVAGPAVSRVTLGLAF